MSPMPNDTFTLRASDEYIELTQLLKVTQIAQSGGHAKLLVEEGLVVVNGQQELRKRRKLRSGDTIEVEGTKITLNQ